METSRPPGCLLALVSLADAMAADVSTPLGDFPAATAARYVLDFLIEGLVAAGRLDVEMDVGVFGYRGTPDGLAFEWLLPVPEPPGAFAPLAEIAAADVLHRADGHPRKWVRAAAVGGSPAPAAALARAHRVLAWWAAARGRGRPPVFVHCATADEWNAAAAAAGRAIRALAVPSGPARVLEWIFKPGADAGFPSDAVWGLLFDDIPAVRVVAPAGPPAPAFVVERAFWSAKRGNDPGMWEDAYAVGACGTVAAVCDGASDGIFCRDWAARLAARFVADRPDLSAPAAVGRWVAAARADWRVAIDYPKLRWSQQAKVDDPGGSATLLGLEVGPADAAGDRAWKATAVGDACLFWVRSPDEWLAFPIVDAGQLSSHPPLLRTKAGAAAPPAVFAQGRCREGDLFLLATDAVAGKLLTDAASGPADWDGYAGLSPDDWAAEFDRLRDAGGMVNDDCTLLVLRVAPAPPADPTTPRTGDDPAPDGATLITQGDVDALDP